MAIPLLLLAIGSIFVGFIGKDMMIGIGTHFWGNSIFILPSNSTLLESEFVPQAVRILPLVFTIGGIFLAFFINQAKRGKVYSYKAKTSRLGLALYTILNRRWFFDKVYNDFFSERFMKFGYLVSFKRLDKGCFEIIGPYGISLLFSRVTRQISKLQSGMIYHYAVIMLLGLVLFITCVGLWDSLEQFVDNRLYFILFVGYVVLSTLSPLVKPSPLYARAYLA